MKKVKINVATAATLKRNLEIAAQDAAKRKQRVAKKIRNKKNAAIIAANKNSIGNLFPGLKKLAS